jgi:hypothetical protein
VKGRPFPEESYRLCEGVTECDKVQQLTFTPKITRYKEVRLRKKKKGDKESKN